MRGSFKKPKLSRLSFEDCIRRNKNPNPDHGGKIFRVSSEEEAREIGFKDGESLIKALKEQKTSYSYPDA